MSGQGIGRAGYAAMTHPGKVREVNEDGYYADGRLFMVADGMGGHQAGEVASSLAIEAFVNTFESHQGEGVLETLLEAAQEANRAIRREARADPSRQGMGTTLTAAFLQDEGIFLAHVGDSRAYLFDGESLRQLTQDHSLVAELVLAGKLSPEEARNHPRRNIITRALGIEDAVEVDLLRVERPVGGLLLLCTDGLSGELSDEEILALLRRGKAEGSGPAEMAEWLLEAALESGGSDNITLVLAELAAAPEAEVASCALAFAGDPDEPGGGSGESGSGAAFAMPGASLRPPTPKRRTGGRALVLTLLALLMLSALAVLFFVPYLKGRSYYVGIDGSGNIALYKGLPWKPLGMSLSEIYRTSLAPAENLPEEKRERLLHPKLMDLEGAERDFISLTREAQSGVRVPDFRGMTWEEAEELAGKAELVLTLEGEVPPAPGSRVAWQSPQPGELAYKLDRVVVGLEPGSSGENGGPVPPMSPNIQSED